PGRDGFAVCREVRTAHDLPILILTARDNDIDQVLGLELGADDYVVKPVEPRVLVARINALLRRRRMAYGPEHKILRFGALTSDPAARAVKLDGDSSPAPVTSSISCLRSPPKRARYNRARRFICSFTSGNTTASIARSTCASRTCARSLVTRRPRASARCGATDICSCPTPGREKDDSRLRV